MFLSTHRINIYSFPSIFPTYSTSLRLFNTSTQYIVFLLISPCFPFFLLFSSFPPPPPLVGTHIVVGVTIGGHITTVMPYDPCQLADSDYSTAEKALDGFKEEVGEFTVYRKFPSMSFMGQVVTHPIDTIYQCIYDHL